MKLYTRSLKRLLYNEWKDGRTDGRPDGTSDCRTERCLPIEVTLGSLKVALVHTCTTAIQIELESCSWLGLVRFLICYKKL